MNLNQVEHDYSKSYNYFTRVIFFLQAKTRTSLSLQGWEGTTLFYLDHEPALKPLFCDRNAFPKLAGRTGTISSESGTFLTPQPQCSQVNDESLTFICGLTTFLHICKGEGCKIHKYCSVQYSPFLFF